MVLAFVQMAAVLGKEEMHAAERSKQQLLLQNINSVSPIIDMEFF